MSITRGLICNEEGKASMLSWFLKVLGLRHFSPRHMGCDLVLGLKVVRVPGFVFFLRFGYVL